MGGQCEAMFMDEPILFKRHTITADPAYSMFVNQAIGEDVSASIQIDIRNSNFLNLSDIPAPDHSPTYGAALVVAGSLNTHTVIANVNFTKNSANYGPAIDLTACTSVVVWGCTFTGNTATEFGGAIHSHVSLNTLSWDGHTIIGNCTFEDNSALVGGAVYGAQYSRFNVTASTQFHNNTATLTGGAMHCDSCDWLAVGEGTLLQQNCASVDGGGLCCNKCAGFQLKNAHLLNNR